LRKALGDPAEDPKFIETVPKRGYRFIAAVRERGEPQVASPARAGEAPAAVGHTAWSRPAILGVCAAVLVLVTSTVAYFYSPSAGQRVDGGLPAIHSLAVLPLRTSPGTRSRSTSPTG
jgi:hypothetical protein